LTIASDLAESPYENLADGKGYQRSGLWETFRERHIWSIII
jgi:hypothetical protein